MNDIRAHVYNADGDDIIFNYAISGVVRRLSEDH